MNRALRIIFISVLLLPFQDVSAQKRYLFGTVNLENIQPTEGFIWTLASYQQPFPKELALSRTSGCAIASFLINESRHSKEIELVSSVPEGVLERPVKKLINSLSWLPVDAKEPTGPEKRIMRFNFCLSDESYEKAMEFCSKLSKVPCE